MTKRKEIIIDSFAGGGGASLGIAWATGRAPDIAINHDAAALAMHEANHPSTRHVHEDVWAADLKKLTDGQKVALLWASPDCKHFSRAKGGKPVNKTIRSLAWVTCKWASQVRPKIILLENVREFADWGPLVPAWRCPECDWRGTEGQATLIRVRRKCPRCECRRLKVTEDLIPDPSRKGLTFRRFLGRLRNLGYDVQYKNLNAADYGAPTNRRRLFLVARRDKLPIEWPEPTHCDPKKLHTQPLYARVKPWRTAAECIDWSLPCPSIFGRDKDLVEKTMERIARGLMRYVLENPQPYIVQVNNSGTTGRGSYTWPQDEPLRTVTASNGFGVAAPYIVPITHSGDRNAHSLTDPLRTITSAHRGELALITPFIAQLAHGEGKKGRWGCGSNPVDVPLGTVHAGGNNHALVSAWLVKHFGGMTGVALDTPQPTTTAIATQNQLACAYLARFNHGDKQWNGVDEPLGVITSQGNKFGLVFAFLVKYFGTAVGQNLFEPMHTATGKARFGLVMVTLAPGHHEPAVAVEIPGYGLYVIADIGMRMLTPRELARAQGFPDTYLLTGTKTAQVAKIGNSVCPPIVKALVQANCRHLCRQSRYAQGAAR